MPKSPESEILAKFFSLTWAKNAVRNWQNSPPVFVLQFQLEKWGARNFTKHPRQIPRVMKQRSFTGRLWELGGTNKIVYLDRRMKMRRREKAHPPGCPSLAPSCSSMPDCGIVYVCARAGTLHTSLGEEACLPSQSKRLQAGKNYFRIIFGGSTGKSCNSPGGYYIK